MSRILRAKHPKGAITTLIRVKPHMKDAEFNEFVAALRYKERNIVLWTWGSGWIKARIAQRRT